MPGTRTTTAKLLIWGMLPVLAASAQETWFPMAPGSIWVYRGSWTSAQALRVEVTGIRLVGGREYAAVKGWPGRQPETQLRQDAQGRIWELTPGAAEEVLFLNADAKRGEDAGRAGDDCNGPGEVVERGARIRTAFGEYGNGLVVRFNSGPCADAGVETDMWMPWVGLVQRTFQTIAGPRSYDLVYARLGDVTVLTPGEISFSLAADKAVHVPADVLPTVVGATEEMNVRLTLRNATGQPVDLEFPSGQDFDLALKNERGEAVWRWSANRAFPAIFRTEKLTGERVWLEKLPLRDAEGKSWPAGRYTIEGELSTTGRRFQASVGLEIRAAGGR